MASTEDQGFWGVVTSTLMPSQTSIIKKKSNFPRVDPENTKILSLGSRKNGTASGFDISSLDLTKPLLRGTIVYTWYPGRTYGLRKNRYIYLCLQTISGSIYYGPP